mmetsp:Transcript_14307/g.34846  ORF Transcript_14307/g.34846 Transcript_14307/m.34846 type:complete len:273 (+) Transcript_14307:637-1455(+)
MGCSWDTDDSNTLIRILLLKGSACWITLSNVPRGSDPVTAPEWMLMSARLSRPLTLSIRRVWSITTSSAISPWTRSWKSSTSASSLNLLQPSMRLYPTWHTMPGKLPYLTCRKSKIKSLKGGACSPLSLHCFRFSNLASQIWLMVPSVSLLVMFMLRMGTLYRRNLGTSFPTPRGSKNSPAFPTLSLLLSSGSSCDKASVSVSTRSLVAPMKLASFIVAPPPPSPSPEPGLGLAAACLRACERETAERGARGAEASWGMTLLKTWFQSGRGV